MIFSKPLHFASSIDPLLGDIEVLDCYKSISVEVEDLALGLYKMAATMHCLAMDLFPTISLTWPSNGYFTFWCKVEETASKA